MNEQLLIEIKAKIDNLEKNLSDAQKQVKDFSSKGESGFKKFSEASKTAGKAVGASLAAVGIALAASGAALGALAESTREYRTEQAKLNSAFEAAGSSAEQAKETYNDLYRVLGDSGQATEAAQHLAKLTTEEKALSEWTKICQGVYAQFGDSLAIEGLTEAVNHTAQLGEVQGTLADALEWSGISVDEFNEQLFWCNSESEREKLIRDTLNGLYTESAEAYEENAASILAANEAQAKLTDATAALGAAVEPLVTLFKAGLAVALVELVPNLELVSQGVQNMVAGVEGGTEQVSAGIAGMLDTLLTKATEMLPSLLAIGVDIIEALVRGIVDAFPQVVNSILTLLPQIIDALVTVIPLITGAILGALPAILTAIVQAIAMICEGLADMLPDIVDQIVEVIPLLIQVLIDSIPILLDASIELLMAIVDAIPEIIPPLVDALPELVDSLIDTLLDNYPVLVDASIELFMALVDAVPIILPSLVRAIPKIISSLVDGLIKAVPQVLTAAGKMFGAIVTAATKVPKQILGALATIVTTVKNNLVNKLKSALNFKWSLPELKMPTITVVWKNSPAWMAEAAKFLGLQGIPSFGVKWNARGGVFDKPTLFSYGSSLQGIGENGAEAVVPLENNLEWLNKLADMLGDRISTDTPIVLKVDGKVFAQTAVSSINQLTKQKGKLALNLI